MAFAKAKKVLKTSADPNYIYSGTITGDGVPSVPTTLNVSVTTDTWTAWTIPMGVRAMLIKSRNTSNAFKISTNEDGSNYVTINAGDSYQLDEMFGPQTTTKLHFQSVTASTVIEILIWRDGQDCNT